MNWLAKPQENLQRRGFDLVAPFDVALYNSSVPESARLVDTPAICTGFVIGNTRWLWQHFISWLAVGPERLVGASARDEGGGRPGEAQRWLLPNPLDQFVEQEIRAAIAGMSGIDQSSPKAAFEEAQIWYAHQGENGYVSVQTAAELAGLGTRSPGGLCVHPRFGPWISLRALVVVPYPLAHPVVTPARPCPHCDDGCRRALANMQRDLDIKTATAAGLTVDWRRWLALRDACPLGAGYRFSEDQIQYHYEKSADHLRRVVMRYRESGDVGD